MSRSPRLIASLLRSLVPGSLLLGTAIAPALGGLAASSLLVSCADESQPEYWIEKLDDAAWRPRAIKRLAQFFEDSMTKAEKDMNHPEVKSLVEKLVGPLTDIYANQYQNLDEENRENLINLLSSFKDTRTEPALKQAFDEFGKTGRGGKDVKWASRAVRDLKLKGAAPAVFAAFKKTQPSTKDGAYYRDLNEALLAIADPAWSAELIPMLDQDFPIMDPQKQDPSKVDELRDRAYQTITAAQVLGEIGSPDAVKPLIKVILDPAKADAGNESLLSLTKIGKPSVDAAVQLLQDKDADLAQYHQRRIQKVSGADKPPGGTPHVAKAAIILGALGRTEAIKPMIEAIAAAKQEEDKGQLLMSLSMLPHTPEVKTAFTDQLRDMDVETKMQGASALQALSEPATMFFDPSLVDLLVERAEDMKDDNLGKSLMALAAIKIMDELNMGKVGKLIDSLPKKDAALGTHLDKIRNGFAMTSKLVAACKKDAACYLGEARKQDNQSDKTQLVGMKALYMVGVYGSSSTSAALVEAMGDLKEGSLRYVACQVIDHLNPKGSADIAKQLDEIVQKNARSMDKDKAANDKPLRDALYRLRARAS